MMPHRVQLREIVELYFSKQMFALNVKDIVGVKFGCEAWKNTCGMTVAPYKANVFQSYPRKAYPIDLCRWYRRFVLL